MLDRAESVALFGVPRKMQQNPGGCIRKQRKGDWSALPRPQTESGHRDKFD